MKVNILNLSKKTDTLEEDIDNILLKFYPIGSIYLSISDINPGETFGGTWESWGSGRVPVGVDTSQTEFNTVEKIGGEKTHKLTATEMPSHTHTFAGNPHSHTLNSHTHSFSATTSTKTLEGGFECRRYGNSSSQTDVVGIKATAGTHGVFSRIVTAWGGSHQVLASNGSATNPSVDAIDFNGNHNHTVSGTTGKASGNTSSTTISGTNTSVGGDSAHNNLQPYITCYMWKRVA